MTSNSLVPVDEPYKRQMTSYRRTRSAILEGTKSLIATVGLQKTNMIDIADTSQVSRATLYNHFRDKGSVIRALLESEVERIFQMIDSDMPPVDALTGISLAISSDSALRTMRTTDPAILAQMLFRVEDPLWQKIHEGLKVLVHDEKLAGLAQLWLAGQVMQPIPLDESREQARSITSLIQQGD